MSPADSRPSEEARTRRPWLGFLLNLILPPGGYVYAGFPRWGLTVAVGTIIIGLAAAAWTLLDPPGVYGDPWRVGRSWAPALAVSGLAQLILAVHAAFLCGRTPEWRAKGRRLSGAALLMWIAPLAVAVLVRLYAPIATYSTASVAMAPTLHPNDILLARGARSECGSVSVSPGDVIAIRRGGVTYVKRAIARGGQTFALRHGRTVIDGVAADQRFIAPMKANLGADGPPGAPGVFHETLPGGPTYRILKYDPPGQNEDVAAVRVPPGSWYVLGDNRDNSMDSRFWGPVRQSDVCGVFTRILYAQDAARIGARP